jgi:outer membrane protein assembly factor BamB
MTRLKNSLNKGLLWVVSPALLLMVLFDSAPSASAAPSVVPHFDGLFGVAVSSKHLWVTNVDSNSITELSVNSGKVIRIINAKADRLASPEDISYSGSHLWVSDVDGPAVTELNASNGTLVRVIDAKKDRFDLPTNIVVNGSHLWVLNVGGNSITELNASDGSLVRVFDARGRVVADANQAAGPNYMALSGQHLWVTDFSRSGDSLVEFDALSGSIVRTIKVTSRWNNNPGCVELQSKFGGRIQCRNGYNYARCESRSQLLGPAKRPCLESFSFMDR